MGTHDYAHPWSCPSVISAHHWEHVVKNWWCCPFNMTGLSHYMWIYLCPCLPNTSFLSYTLHCPMAAAKLSGLFRGQEIPGWKAEVLLLFRLRNICNILTWNSRQGSLQVIYIHKRAPSMVRPQEIKSIIHHTHHHCRKCLFVLLKMPCWTSLPYDDIYWETLALSGNQSKYLMSIIP